MQEHLLLGITRRQALTRAAGGAAALAASANFISAAQSQQDATSETERAIHNGHIKQTICRWCYGKIPLEKLCQAAVRLGFKGIDLVGPDTFPTLRKYGLVGTMTSSHTIPKGLNSKENWDECLTKIRKAIDATSEAGFPNVICFSGNRNGLDPDEGMKNCRDALKQVVGLAEEKNVTICMELLNSKVDHHDYMCDHTSWGVPLVQMVGSERFKLLYDIYHMQIMEGDVIRTIRQHKECFAHYHTGGVPGRHEIDETQELYYPAVIRAIVETGYKGWLGQEFIPAREPLASLAQGGRICDV
jgi:hydroxypyruvate isomerase